MADPRFSALSSDPRYRLPSRKEARTAVDPRFGRLFTDQDFRKKASVDRYGRKIKPEQGKKELEKLYRLEKEKPKKQKERETLGSSDGSAESDEADEKDDAVVSLRDPARDGGFSASESAEESSSEEEESDVEAELAEGTAGQEQTEDIPMGEVSHRVAAVNLDWDNIRASDIMAVASSFVPSSGRIEQVTVYPSEFGRERLEREEIEGPPRAIFASSKRTANADVDNGDEESSDDEDEDERIKRQLLQNQADEGTEFDSAALRQYQLERLRYYYAVITCGNKATAKHLYDSMDGREYLNTANFFDLRFIPDDTSFEDDMPRDECKKLPDGYKPNEFRTEALTHSKARLTWDDDDTTRKEVQKRAFSRGEIEENDLQAYIGSDSSDAESVSSRKSTVEDRRAQKKAAQKEKMRAAFGLGDGYAAVKGKKRNGDDETVGDMQITFTSGLNAGKGENGVFENEPQDEESTRARYIRKEKERKQKRKERAKTARSGDAATDEAAANSDAETGAAEDGDIEDAGFNDPFFADPAASAAAEKNAKKAARQQKREAQIAKDAENEGRRKELELLMAEDQADEVRHFDMREVEKAEKEAKRKGKKSKKGKKASADDAADGVSGEAGFQVQTEDPRFKALFESHEFAIDPTNPRYKGTEGMKALLEEGRKKRQRTEVEGEEQTIGKRSKKAVPSGKSAGDEELKGLVARLKTRKAKPTAK